MDRYWDRPLVPRELLMRVLFSSLFKAMETRVPVHVTFMPRFPWVDESVRRTAHADLFAGLRILYCPYDRERTSSQRRRP
jgi:hypothetical protein